MRRARLIAAGVLLTIALALASVPALAYLKLGTRVQSRTLNLKWGSFPIRYFVTDRGAPQVSAQDFQSAVTRAFDRWHQVKTAESSSQLVGFTQANPGGGDGATVLGFMSRPELERVLAATSFRLDTVTGEVVESDIFFNTSFAWSVDAAGVSGRHDLESIAVHEIGHLLGLSHSALGETELVPGGRRVIGAESVMFPIAFASGTIHDRTLKADDIAGITDIYSNAEGRRSTGSISGTVTRNGRGVPGAHVVAFNPTSGTLVGGFSLNEDGTFTIAGLEPGAHVLRVEPLDDGDLESFFESSFTVDLNFRVKFHDRIVVVPRGGGVRNVEIKVQPK